jgi:hypothetical protein
MRDFHHLTRAFDGFFPVDTCKAAVIVHAWQGGPRLWMSGRIGGTGVPPVSAGGQDARPPMRFDSRPDWWYGFFYREEAHRGQDCREDLFVPGWFHAAGAGELRITFIARALFSADTPPEVWHRRPAGVRGTGVSPAQSTAETAVPHHTGETPVPHHTGETPVPHHAGETPVPHHTGETPVPHHTGETPVPHLNIEQRLRDAADAFVVTRLRADGHKSNTILAGYHWFGDWGRDTFIAMPGLLFETGRFEEAFVILETFAGVQHNGLIPNRFSDYGDGCDYNSVDASLWYLHAATRYFELTGNQTQWEGTLYPACREIVEHFVKGTAFDIFMDTDGLISAGNAQTQLTWMDAKFGDTVFTPRHGKPVEINALWYHGLRMLERLCAGGSRGAGVPPARGQSPRRPGSGPALHDASRYGELADRAKTSFAGAFWNDAGRYLYDTVRGQWQDPAIRPNQIVAVSLPQSPLSAEQQRAVLDCVREHLLTPYGLRSLSPGDPAYRPRCEGNPFERDRAYHQGTVWGWLIGPYVEAVLRVHENSAAAKSEVRTQLQPLIAHLDEAGLGSVSEIFDGDPPHTPRGCIAQAWSVAELLRAWRLTT